ncbi:MAG: hypothetical protein Q9160_003699 [Pyrenula sp. 1 TL-2023]
MPPEKGRSIFIGNIPFNLPEEEIVALLSQAGTVTKFRLMTNPDTGKPKGFGFADFVDADQAASAVRNLNDFEIQGRKIRVDYPHNNEKDSVPQDYQAPVQDGSAAQPPSLPPLPPGTELPLNLKCTDAISQTLNTLPPSQLLDVLAQMKSLVTTDPNRAQELLKQAPQLSYAIFQALILMNLVDPKVLGQVVEGTTRPAPQSIPQPPPQPVQNYGYPQPTPIPAPTPQHYPTPVQPPPSNAPSSQLNQEEMIRQVMQLDQATIDTFPPPERAQIMALRAQLGVR